MKQYSILIILLCFAYNGLFAIKGIENNKVKSTAELVEILSSESFEGRKPGSNGMLKATSFICNYLQAIKIPPFFNSYLDTLSVLGFESYNIVGVIESSHPTDDYILIGAHLDHLGKQESVIDSVFNGANDNASGVTAVLQISKELKNHSFNKHILIVLFTGEEYGLVGSNHLAKRLKRNKINLEYVINLEMIGVPLTKTPHQINISGFNKSNFARVSNLTLNENFIVRNELDNTDFFFKHADNYPFYTEFNIPSHTLSTFDIENYKYIHSVEDELSKLSIEHMDRIIDKLTTLIINLLKNNPTLELNTKT